MIRPRQHPAGRGLTYSATITTADAPELPAMPPDFCWTHAELYAPAFVCETFLNREAR